jgi:lipoprotein Spr
MVRGQENPALGISAAALRVPRAFLRIPYNGSQHPGAPYSSIFEAGANCQRFVYELLKHFGYELPEFRSSELWLDRIYTHEVPTDRICLRPLDILLFNRRRESWGAHLGLHLGGGQVIHLAKAVGYPAIWRIEEFAQHARYRVIVGAKRIKDRRASPGRIR